ncbi:uncharacterized protein PHALS_00529 [Plasmopara halstedii]|uniref:Uncharacterized protein n=1 Tax=Plasmopara halstedii TaxID=4781 RepID=A0A0P1A701_PLAHL|nr:uncharacterized protein PHALS_00529 [Plasmopara halstedii]CEG36208.1 hypothetical protein PHALS_00529 [Plasmopara halstedii]|eukprot:XP_024572577.1 hypothetical protein PHALS_00529 [Plasmopara halstedii]
MSSVIQASSVPQKALIMSTGFTQNKSLGKEGKEPIPQEQESEPFHFQGTA